MTSTDVDGASPEGRIRRPLEASERRGRRLPGGHAIDVKAPASSVASVLQDPREASSILGFGRWEMPFGKGAYIPGSEKRCVHHILGFTWFTDKRLVEADQSAVVWEFLRPVVTLREAWRMEEHPEKKRTEVSVVFEPRTDKKYALYLWRFYVEKRRAREARRLLMSMKARLEARPTADGRQET